MAQQWKIDEIAKLKEELKEYSSFVFTDYRGMKVEQMSSFEGKSSAAKGAVPRGEEPFRETGDEGSRVRRGGRISRSTPRRSCTATIDLSEISKTLVDAAKDTSASPQGGIRGGAVITAEGIQQISRLPSRQVLIARTLGMLNAPIAGFVYILGGLLPKFLRTLKAIESLAAEAQTEVQKDTPQEAATQAS